MEWRIRLNLRLEHVDGYTYSLDGRDLESMFRGRYQGHKCHRMSTAPVAVFATSLLRKYNARLCDGAYC
jgi:hypothetical protein